MTRTPAPSILPTLSSAEARHSERVSEAVRAAVVAHEGWLAFDDYLQLVLYAPGLGYYSAGSPKLGRGGDFITAPELSELFGRCVARQCAQLLQVGAGDILELGAGSGALAASILPTLESLGVLPRHYYILEISADLRARQRLRLAQLPQHLHALIVWLDALPATPLEGVILLNEVADALPFKRFVVDAATPGGFQERGVALSARGELIEADRPASSALIAELQRLGAELPPWPPGFESELCPLLSPWLAAIAAVLARGAILLIDYGLPRREYYHLERSRGTMRCHFRHRAHERPLLYPGMQDITAWLDFTRVAEGAADAGLEIAGFCTQTAFLLALGIEAEVAAAQAPLERARRASEARTLLLPGEMGEPFKAIALTRALDLALDGFRLQDLRRAL
jgi:SAM-dependent MidA family methyltransferase